MAEENSIDIEAWKGCMNTLLVLGVLGNTLTIWAVGYATFRNKYGFSGDQFLTTTIFILNLAFVDTVYCIFVLSYMVHVADDEPSRTCKFLVLGSQYLAILDGWSIALIACTRGIPYIK